MDQDVVTDLKQFISATVKQETTSIKVDLMSHIDRLDQRIQRLDHKIDRKIDALSAHIADAMDATNEDTEARLKNHERRIKRLEKKTI